MHMHILLIMYCNYMPLPGLPLRAVSMLQTSQPMCVYIPPSVIETNPGLPLRAVSMLQTSQPMCVYIPPSVIETNPGLPLRAVSMLQTSQPMCVYIPPSVIETNPGLPAKGCVHVTNIPAYVCFPPSLILLTVV